MAGLPDNRTTLNRMASTGCHACRPLAARHVQRPNGFRQIRSVGSGFQIFVEDADLHVVAQVTILIIGKHHADEFIFKHQIG